MEGKMSETYDVGVIGGGPGGYVAAIKAAQLGGSVILFEKDTVGGTCLNRGCIPTKTYVKTAEYMHHIKNADKRGILIDPSKLGVDMVKVVDHKNQVVKKLTGGIAGLLDSHGIVRIKGTGTLTKEKKILCEGRTYHVNHIILAGGSKPVIPPIPGADNPRILVSDSILDLDQIPKTLVIIGGGIIGCEFATAFAAFGSHVSIIELADQLVPNMGKDIHKYLQKSLKAMGVKMLLKTSVQEIKEIPSGNLIMKTSDKKEIEADSILIATGRCADLESLGDLKEVINTEKGYVSVRDSMETNSPDIYCVGDMNGQSQLAHAAFKMGEVAAINAMGGNEKVDLRFVPKCLYTLPEAAVVGLSLEECEKEYDVAIGNFSFMANGRALASGETEGFVKVMIDRKYGEILGVQIVGATATEMISEAASLMAMEITAHEVANIIHPHPTYSEAFMEACADALGKCIHLPKK